MTQQADTLVEAVARALRYEAMRRAYAEHGEGNLAPWESWIPDARAVLAVARPLIEAEGWQPIETFMPGRPGDPPSRVLVVCNGVVGEAHYRANDDSDDGWWWAGESPGDYYAEQLPHGSITHWRPLPAPPPLNDAMPEDRCG